MKNTKLKNIIKEQIRSILKESQVPEGWSESGYKPVKKLAGINEASKLNEGDLATYKIEGLSREAFNRMSGLVKNNDFDIFMKKASSMIEDLSDEGFDAKEIFDFLFHNLVSL